MEKNDKKPARNAFSIADAGGEYEVAQTYADDMAKVIQDGSEAGIIKKIIHENEQYEIEKRLQSPETKTNKLFGLLGLVFLLIASTILFYFFPRKAPPEVIPVVNEFESIIFHDESVSIEVVGLQEEEIVVAIRDIVSNTGVKVGGVSGIYLTENGSPVGLRRFIALTKSSFVPDHGSEANLVSDKFLLGVVNGETKDLFILIKMRFLTDIFDSLRAWEEKMFAELHELFGAELTPEKKYLSTKPFQDVIIENKNARTLYDNEGAGVLTYVFADDSSVIISNSESAIREIMTRLASSKVKE